MLLALSIALHLTSSTSFQVSRLIHSQGRTQSRGQVSIVPSLGHPLMTTSGFRSLRADVVLLLSSYYLSKASLRASTIARLRRKSNGRRPLMDVLPELLRPKEVHEVARFAKLYLARVHKAEAVLDTKRYKSHALSTVMHTRAN
jgi:hypothetical protein